jgi:hypothetical protein
MGHLVQTIQRAPEHQQFAPGCFDSQIGKTVPLKYEGRQIDNCKIVGAEVSGDGTEVALTVELPDGVGLSGTDEFLSGLSISN